MWTLGRREAEEQGAVSNALGVQACRRSAVNEHHVDTVSDDGDHELPVLLTMSAEQAQRSNRATWPRQLLLRRVVVGAAQPLLIGDACWAEACGSRVDVLLGSDWLSERMFLTTFHREHELAIGVGAQLRQGVGDGDVAVLIVSPALAARCVVE